VEIYKEGVVNFSKFVRFEVGDGSQISFWHNVWCGEQALKIPYPNLFSIARCKGSCVADHLQFRNGRIQWNIIFTRLV
jgi:hypothetical protein